MWELFCKTQLIPFRPPSTSTPTRGSRRGRPAKPANGGRTACAAHGQVSRTEWLDVSPLDAVQKGRLHDATHHTRFRELLDGRHPVGRTEKDPEGPGGILGSSKVHRSWMPWGSYGHIV